jgi:hypothetical protein
MDLSSVPLVRCIQEEFLLKEEQPFAPDGGRKANAPLYLFPHQVRILEHVFSTVDGKLPYSTFIYSAIKKSGKTEIGAAITYAWARVFGGEIYSIANDEEQAASRMFKRVTETLEVIGRRRPKSFSLAIHEDHQPMARKDGRHISRLVRDKTIRFSEGDQQNLYPHTLTYIPQDYAGEAGGMPALTLWDELWAYSSEGASRLWSEMQPVPTLPHSMRVVTTYAGFYGESELLYSIFEALVDPDPQTDEPRGTRVPGLEDLPCYHDLESGYFCYWDEEPRMPWHTEEFLERAKLDPTLKGRQGEYDRLWRNRWSTGSEPFIDIKLIDALMEEGESRGLVNHFAHYVQG